MIHTSYFYAQGEDAQPWLDIFDQQGAIALLKSLSDAGALVPNFHKPPMALSDHIDHEKLGDFVISYSFSLVYIGISKPADANHNIEREGAENGL